jgi:hypothetical protein
MYLPACSEDTMDIEALFADEDEFEENLSYTAEEKADLNEAINACFDRGWRKKDIPNFLVDKFRARFLTIRKTVEHWAQTRKIAGMRTDHQYSATNEHGIPIDQYKLLLRAQGFEVLEEDNKIGQRLEERFKERSIIKCRTRGTINKPDLLAIRGDLWVAVEVMDRGKSEARFLDQIERYRVAVDHVIVVLPFRADNIDFRGVCDVRLPQYCDIPKRSVE